MPFYSTMAIVATTDNVSANYATNTWTCEADDLTALQAFHNELVGFYTTMQPFFGELVRTSDGLELTSYNRLDPEPRPPVLTTFANLTPSEFPALPPEVALCMSFQGERLAGEPQSRRRGRIYFPFLSENGNGDDGRPMPGLVTALAGAGEDLLDASATATTWTWLVYSTVAPGYTVITNGWVDNEWDTQRRRGRESTSRTVFV